MSYDDLDAARDEFYESIRKELYPEHKDQAISEFTNERLQSFYLKNPDVMRPAVDALQEGKKLLDNQHYPASLVFFVTSIELLLKATLLKPVIYGLIHNEALADVIVDITLGQAGFYRYENLLSRIYEEQAGIELSSIYRSSPDVPLLKECKNMQDIRNRVIHQGSICTKGETEICRQVAIKVYGDIVRPVLYSIGLDIVAKGRIVKNTN